jgi:hypothetical protein
MYNFELTPDEEMKTLDTGMYINCIWDPTVAPLEQ